jgi:hypothetical protein
MIGPGVIDRFIDGATPDLAAATGVAASGSGSDYRIPKETKYGRVGTLSPSRFSPEKWQKRTPCEADVLWLSEPGSSGYRNGKLPSAFDLSSIGGVPFETRSKSCRMISAFNSTLSSTTGRFHLGRTKTATNLRPWKSQSKSGERLSLALRVLDET